MMVCLDAHYRGPIACAAAVVFDDWSAVKPTRWYSTIVKSDVGYEPGRFYLRELAPILTVIKQIMEPIHIFIIDGYCYLSEDFIPGLGSHLYSAIQESSSVIGVAKNRFKDSRHAEKLFRGDSSRALFITSLGLDPKIAASKIALMAGPYRIPLILKMADQFAREGIRKSRICSQGW